MNGPAAKPNEAVANPVVDQAVPTLQICLVCRGEGKVPYVAVDRFTGTNKLTTATCCRCRGSGRVESN
jgi:hypothetical protein